MMILTRQALLLVVGAACVSALHSPAHGNFALRAGGPVLSVRLSQKLSVSQPGSVERLKGGQLDLSKVDAGDLLYSAGGSILAFMLLAFIQKQLADHGITVICPPLAAVAVLLFAAPAAPLGKQWNTAVGFLVSSAASFGVYKLVGDGFMKDFGGTRALMVGASILAMKLTNSIHPPAGAYAVLLADAPAMKALGWKYMLFPGFAGVAILLAFQYVFNEINKALKKKTS